MAIRSSMHEAGGAMLEKLVDFDQGHRGPRSLAARALHAVLKEEAPRLPAAGFGSAHGTLQGVLDSCLAKAAVDRYGSVRDLIVQLKAA